MATAGFVLWVVLSLWCGSVSSATCALTSGAGWCYRVIDGMDTLDAMEKVPVKGKKKRPVTDIILKSVTIHANPLADRKE